jgi:hypothetical protein
MGRNLDTRLQRLEAATRARPGEWPAEVEAAKRRALARLWLRLGDALDTPTHPAVVSARTFLQDDTPEQGPVDLDTLQRWEEAHPDTLYPAAEGSRAGLERKLEEMRQRMEANRGALPQKGTPP